MKKVFLFMTLALVAICSMTFVSCSKDDDNSKPVQEVYFSLGSLDKNYVIGTEAEVKAMNEDFAALMKSKFSFTKVEYPSNTHIGVKCYTTSDKAAEAKLALSKITNAELRTICDKYSKNIGQPTIYITYLESIIADAIVKFEYTKE